MKNIFIIRSQWHMVCCVTHLQRKPNQNENKTQNHYSDKVFDYINQKLYKKHTLSIPKLIKICFWIIKSWYLYFVVLGLFQTKYLTNEVSQIEKPEFFNLPRSERRLWLQKSLHISPHSRFDTPSWI